MWGNMATDRRTKSKWILDNLGKEVWTGFNWHETGSNGGLRRNFGLHKNK